MRLAALALMVFCGPTFALDVETYEKDKDSEVSKMYVTAAAQGVFWANVFAYQQKGVRLYCPPGKLKANPDMYIDMLNSKIETYHRSPNFNPRTQIEFLLIQALQETFPCR